MASQWSELKEGLSKAQREHVQSPWHTDLGSATCLAAPESQDKSQDNPGI